MLFVDFDETISTEISFRDPIAGVFNIENHEIAPSGFLSYFLAKEKVNVLYYTPIHQTLNAI